MNHPEFKPVVSVIIPTHNRPEYLKRALTSVQEQTFDKVEAIVVDDASSTDLTGVIRDFPKVIFLRNKTNRGPCYSRNRGLKQARGEFINFLDDDDKLYPQKLEKQVAIYRNSPDHKLGMVTCHVLDRRSGKKIVTYNKLQGNIYKKLLYGYALAGTETVLFKKSGLNEVAGFDEKLQSSQEYDLFIRMAKNFTVDYVDKILTEKYKSTNQISVNFNKKLSGAHYLFKKHSDAYLAEGLFFWLFMRLKFWGLSARFMVGKYLGERYYRLLCSD